MDSVLVSMVVTAAFFALNAALGIRLGRSAKPYGTARLAAHLLLFLLVSGGVIASAYKLYAVVGDKSYATAAIYVTALTLFTNLLIGLAMTLARKKDHRLILAHKFSTALMGLSILASIVFLIAGA